MKFLVDAQLPIRLTRRLSAAGHDAVHTSELPEGNRTSDAQIASQADSDRVVVTKDGDFRNSHLLRSTPRRLLLVATGNISNNHYSRSSTSTLRRSSQPLRRPLRRAARQPTHRP